MIGTKIVLFKFYSYKFIIYLETLFCTVQCYLYKDPYMKKKLPLKKSPSPNLQILHSTTNDKSTASNENLLNLAFDNSMLANIITVINSGNILMVNNAAAKLLGYSKKVLITKNRSDIFDIDDSDFKKMLKQRAEAGQSLATITAIKKTGKQFPCEIASALFTGEDGIEKAISTLVDLSKKIKDQKIIDDNREEVALNNIDLAKAKQHKIDCKKERIIAGNVKRAKRKSDARLAENNAWIKHISKTSYDVMWDWDIATGKIYVGDSLTEVFGYSIQANTINFSDFICALLAEDKKAVILKLNKTLASDKKNWNDSFKILRKDATTSTTTIRASIVRDEQNNAIRLIGAIQDTTPLHVLQQNLDHQITLQKNASETFFLTTKVSFDMIWDWNLENGKVFRGEGAEELFGHNFIKDQGNVLEWRTHIHPDDKAAVEESLVKARESTDITWECTYRFFRADGTVADVFDRANIFRNEDGKAYRMIGALQDISHRKELEDKLKHEIAINENLLEAINMNFKTLAQPSEINLRQLTFDDADQPNIISAASTGKILQVNSAACKLLGYTKKELLSKNCSDILDTKTSSYKKMLKQRLIEGYTSAFVMATMKSGKPFACEISSAVFLDEQAVEKVMNSLKDISQGFIKSQENKAPAGEAGLAAPEMKSRQKLLTEYEDTLKLMFNLSSDILYDHDLNAKTVIVNDAFEKELGFTVTNYKLKPDEILIHIHHLDIDAYKAEYDRVVASQESEWKYTFRFIKADQSLVSLVINGIVLRERNGRAYRIIGYMQDLDKQLVMEKKMESEIMLREQQIEAATLDAKEQERTDIGKELHDNVNQLLGASKMYLEMAKRGGPNTEMYLNRSSQYTVTAIEEIRKLTKGLASDYIKNLGLAESIENLVNDSMEMNKLKISFSAKQFLEDSVDDKFKLNIFRIVQEQLNNILKHAYAGEINIVLSQNQYALSLIISDNGVGFDTQKKYKGIGLANIRSRALTYNGTADFISQPGQGCVLAVKFSLAGNAHYKLDNVPAG